MIVTETYTKEWIDGFTKNKRNSNLNPELLEKMIYAFGLLEKLADAGLKFIFKGGTALVLLLNETYRFSIDIDIITTVEPSEIENILNELIQNQPFTRWEMDKRRSFIHQIPKAHYKLHWLSALNQKEKTVLLDVLFAENPYAETTQIPIHSPWLKSTEPYLSVHIPTNNAILGDKLTAFAPNTIGIPYGRDKYLQIIKQLYDISILIDRVTNVEMAYRSFQQIAQIEIGYRQLNISDREVCKDIFDTALLISKRENNKTEPNQTNFEELKLGLNSFKSYLTKGTFYIEQAIEAAAKTAWFTQLLQQNRHSEFVLYTSQTDLSQWIIQNPKYNFLNRLKKTNKTAFFYWYKALEILGLNN